MAAGMVIVLVLALWHPGVWQVWGLFAALLIGEGAYWQALHWTQGDKTVAASCLIIGSIALVGLTMAFFFDDLIVAFAVLGILLSLLSSLLLSRRAGRIAMWAVIVIGVPLTFLLRTSVLSALVLPLSGQTKDWVDLGVFLLTLFLGTYVVALSQEGTHLAFTRLVEQSNRLKIVNKELAHEIHERQQAEATLARLNSTLEALVAERTAEVVAEKEKSDAILRSVADAICVTDLDMRIQYVNEAFVTLTGYSAAEIIGRPLFWLLARENLDIERCVKILREMTDVPKQCQITMRRKEGRTYDAEMTAAPLHNGQGQRTGYVFSHQDITKFKALERARSQFITNVSHELRTPVTSLKLSIYLLKVERSPEKVAFYLQALETQTARLEHLIQDILEMVSLDSGQGVTVWEELSLATVLNEAVKSYRKQIEARSIELEIAPWPADLPLVKGDPFRLTQAIKEVLENALVFMPSGGKVTLTAAQVEVYGHPWVTLTVRDTGPGIAPDEQPKLFNRFFRGKLAESGHVPGTGLGLSIVYEIMRAHGGNVTVESKEGQGSAFTLWWPVE